MGYAATSLKKYKILLRGPSGVVADIEISGGVALKSNEYEVYGKRGSLAIKGKEIYLKYIDPSQEMLFQKLRQAVNFYRMNVYENTGKS